MECPTPSRWSTCSRTVSARAARSSWDVTSRPTAGGGPGRDVPGRPRRPGRDGARARRPPGRRRALHRLRPSVRAGRQLPVRALGRRRNGRARLGVLPQGTRDGRPAADGARRLAATSRYLARDLAPAGIRVNLVAAGPIRTMAATSIPGFEAIEGGWSGRAPLGWDMTDAEPTARAVAALLSDWFPATTGEIVHVDGDGDGDGDGGPPGPPTRRDDAPATRADCARSGAGERPDWDVRPAPPGTNQPTVQ